MSTMAYDDAARENWARYLYGKDRGHIEYTEQAARCEGMYLGGGEQWSEGDKAILADQGRPAYEFNEILPSTNSAIGYQIHNRMDIAFKPRGEKGDLAVATILSKVVKQVLDATQFHWVETQVFSDGLIEQRGYFDVRMNFDNNIKGEIEIHVDDPRDVIPDPDAKSYDPDKWGDVTKSRWLTLDEIEQFYGPDARVKAEASNDEGHDFGDLDDEAQRNKFGRHDRLGLYDAYSAHDDGLKRFRVIDRQRFVYEKTPCVVFPDSGEVQIEAGLSKESIADAMNHGAVRSTRMRRRVKWTVSTYSTVLHDDYSPYEHFTTVPFFAYFRRGKTRGMIDNAIGPQEALNKAVSQYIHIVNTSANSGWMVEEDSLTNITTEDLEGLGARTGLVLEYKKNSTSPEKITPNPVPTGVDRIIDRATQALKDVTVPEAMRGQQGPEVSGIAIQAKQFASQQQLAVPLDNLAFTRSLLGKRILKLVQRYYDSHRVFRITETDPNTGKEVEQVLEINKFDPDTNSYLYDVTVGDYDVVITEQPMQVTFENSQFQQALEMRKAGIAIPDPAVIRYSALADKHEILAGMQGTKPPEDPTLQAKAKLIEAQARKTDAETVHVQSKTVNEDVTAMYSATQAAQVLMTVPGASGVADGLLRSAAFHDKDAAPIVPAAPVIAAPAAEIPPNTDPLTPVSPARGLNAGIETLAADGLRTEA
ncbi:portal protein [Simplicispira piscis]